MHVPISNSFQRELYKCLSCYSIEKNAFIFIFKCEEGRNPFLFKSNECEWFFSWKSSDYNIFSFISNFYQDKELHKF